jgi:excisionase family DNA binding protein
MTPTEAATATGINKLTILKWIRSGRLAAERIQTPHGPGYDIRPEDLTQALQRPRKVRESTPAPAKGSVVEALEGLRQTLERQTAEIHDLRGQLHQTEQRLTEALRVLPAPIPNDPPKAARRWWQFSRQIN